MNSTNNALLTRLIRTIHAIKETYGFLGLTNLENISHRAEAILIEVRASKHSITPELVSLVLRATNVLQNELSFLGETREERYASKYPDSFQTALLQTASTSHHA